MKRENNMKYTSTIDSVDYDTFVVINNWLTYAIGDFGETWDYYPGRIRTDYKEEFKFLTEEGQILFELTWK